MVPLSAEEVEVELRDKARRRRLARWVIACATAALLYWRLKRRGKASGNALAAEFRGSGMNQQASHTAAAMEAGQGLHGTGGIMQQHGLSLGAASLGTAAGLGGMNPSGVGNRPVQPRAGLGTGLGAAAEPDLRAAWRGDTGPS